VTNTPARIRGRGRSRTGHAREDARPTRLTLPLENGPAYYLTLDPIAAQPDSTTQTSSASGVQDSAGVAVNVEELTQAMENLTTVSGVRHSAGSAVSDVLETEVLSSMTEVETEITTEVETEIKMEAKDELTPEFRTDLKAKAEAALEAEIKEEAKLEIETEASAWLDASSGAAPVVGYASSSADTVVPATPLGPPAWAAVASALDANAGGGIQQVEFNTLRVLQRWIPATGEDNTLRARPQRPTLIEPMMRTLPECRLKLTHCNRQWLLIPTYSGP
jgi:hypothetical protein